MNLTQIVNYLDGFLKISEIIDSPEARNGLQIEKEGKVTRIAAAVDANLLTIEKAIAAKADLLLVHHGLFWNHPAPLVKGRYTLFKQAIRNNLAIYSVHLPLDVHPKLGNNVLLAKALHFPQSRPAFEFKGMSLGRIVRVKISRDQLCQRITRAVGGAPHLIPAGPEVVRELGIITGRAGSWLEKAAEMGVDTFLTGEGNHETFSAAYELKINVIYGGHYATETFGVKALAKQVSEKFDLPWIFLEVPSGL